MSDIKNIDSAYIAHTYARFPVQIVSGKGSVLMDENGKCYIDLGTGIAVNVFGMCDEVWMNAVKAQLDKFSHTSNLYYTEPCAKLAQMLCERTGMKKVFFGNSGAEANECAIKVARKYSAEKKGPSCYTIITLVNSFHGRTLTTLAATGQEHYHELFQPLTPGFVHTPAGDFEALKKLALDTNAAGIMMECVQGEGGVIALPEDFVQKTAAFAKENDIPLIIDEVQTGTGRSGALYAYMNYGIQPDIVSTAKGIGGGLPLGVCMMGEKVQDVLQAGDHGSTFGGNPVCCAGGISILERIDDKLLEGVRERSQFIFDFFEDADGVESVGGMGLMIGIKPVGSAGKIVNAAIDKGVLALTAKDRIRLLPALNIPMDQLSDACGILRNLCAEIKD